MTDVDGGPSNSSGPVGRGRGRGRSRAHRGRWHHGRGRGRSQTSNTVAGEPLNQQPAGDASASPSQAASHPPSPPNPPNPSQAENETPSRGRGRHGRGRGRGRGRGGILAGQTSTIVGSRAFGGHLTAALDAGAPSFVPGQPVEVPTQPAKAPPPPPSTAADLRTRIHEDMDNGHYDCCICLNAVLRTSRLWTCPICWRATHYACMAKWIKQKRIAAGESGDGNGPALRCPACNLELPDDDSVGRERFCWCGKQRSHVVAPAVLPPHSCGRVCGRTRTSSSSSACPHPCPAVCHAGPCPPCHEMGPAMPCFCGRQTAIRPCVETDYSQAWSCTEICNNWLPCGRHRCTRICHPGACGDCVVPLPSICFCGKEHKELACQTRETAVVSFRWEKDGQADQPDTFEGSFHCSSVCERPYDCGIHTCPKNCHPQDREAAHCPRSPDVVTHCPCGQTRLAVLPGVQPRVSCEDAVPSCGKICRKTLSCGHRCAAVCHEDVCPPCEQMVRRTCRCGRTETQAVCGDAAGQEEFVCDTPCRTLLSCGQHKCRNVCCGGRAAATARIAATKSRSSAQPHAPPPEFEAEHVCLQRCGRPLRCGQHACPQLCHRGACLSCTEQMTEGLQCACGRTVLPPPLVCGTTLPPCVHDCTRPLACGHAAVAHRCHEDDQACPRCPQLVSKVCLCGKYTLKRVACGTGDLRCELVCGLPLQCGVHTCTKTCHLPGECEDVDQPCTQPCSRLRLLCDHPCGQPCHGFVTACPEDDPCRSRLVVTCPCQRRKHEVRCLACTADPTPAAHVTAAPACDDECRRLQRNAALKTALQVPDDHEDSHMPYAVETLAAYRKQLQQSRAWVLEQEAQVRAFADDPDERRLRFRPMPAPRRAFLHMLAADYGLDSQSEDPEPHRHVSLFKTPRFVSAPAKTLAQCDALQRRTQEHERLLAAQAAQEAAALRALDAARRRPFNAVLLPTQFADQATVHAEVLADVLPLLEQTSSATAGLPVRQAQFEPATLPSGEAIIRAVAPAAAPAAVEQLLRAALPYIQGLSGESQDNQSEDTRMRLCYVDANAKVIRREGDAQDVTNSEGSSGDDSQWNVVARTAKRVPGTASTTPAPRRGLLTLKKRTPTAVDRQKRMEILAQTSEEERRETTGTTETTDVTEPVKTPTTEEQDNSGEPPEKDLEPVAHESPVEVEP